MEDRTRELITEFIKENALNQFLFLPIVLTKLFRRTTLFLLEDPVEIGKVIKTALITNLGDRHRRIYQQPGSKAQPNINPEKPDVPLNKNDAFQKVQKRRVQEKR